MAPAAGRGRGARPGCGRPAPGRNPDLRPGRGPGGRPGAGVAWFAVRQYETLGRAYTFAATELSIIHGRLSQADEDGWAQEEADAEEAISREHTMWRASRGAG
ncbi:hypothetical protein [Streptomyces sp. NPDC005890]|uniref:hypothetical protein n=1 Tax=Streptomyces sp. NPDC005890 TaxID=3154568 RepID=UPI0033FB486D